MRSGSPSLATVFRTTLGGALVGILGALVLVAAVLVQERQQRIEAATTQAENTSRLMAGYVQQTLEKIDMVMLDVRERVPPEDMRIARGRDPARTEQMHRLLARKLAAIPEVSVLHLTNAAGDHIYSSLAKVPDINIGDRSHFLRHKESATAGLVMSPPLISRTTGRWSVAMTRRLDFADGSFAGTITMVLDLGAIEKFFASLDVGRRGVVNMRDSEMRLMARQPPADKSMGLPVPDHPAFAYLRRGLDHAVFSAPGSVDGVMRLYSFRRVGKFGLYVFAGVAVEDYLAQWRQHLESWGAAYLVLAASALALIGLARRGMLEYGRAQKALAQSETAWAEAMSQFEDAICILDNAHCVVRANRAFCEMTGSRPETVVGRPIAEIIHAGSEIPACPVCRALEEKRDEVIAMEGDHPSNPSGRPVEFTVKVLRDAEDVTTGFMLGLHDLSRERATRAEVEKYRDHLEEVVAARTRELESARDDAQAANRAKSVFLANMSHELRTPLNAILGFAQLMERDGRLTPDQRRNAKTINRSGTHLLSLINDVLDISRIEAGRFKVASDIFDLAAMLTAVEETVRVRAEAKGLRFDVDISAGLARYVLGDVHRLRQVLTNLLGNAVKYTDRGCIGLRALGESDGRVRFEVSDTGPGIAKDEQERIFTAFYQTDLGLAKGEGTGLGLTIAREFVRLMGGELSVASEPGKGSRFAFAIPLPVADAIPGAVGARHVIGLADGQPAPRVLVAEDQADNRQLLEALLTQAGFEVRTVEDGRQAIAGFEAWRPQLILMDMRMPVMDGFAATRTIRRMPGGDKIPIIAVTASALEEDRGQVIGAGCDDMVRKPIDEDRLFELLGRVLGLAFRYAEVAAETGPTGAAKTLATLPQGVREALAKAAAMLDREATLAIAERLGVEHPMEARLIADLVESYRFDRIEALSRLDDGGADGEAAARERT